MNIKKIIVIFSASIFVVVAIFFAVLYNILAVTHEKQLEENHPLTINSELFYYNEFSYCLDSQCYRKIEIMESVDGDVLTYTELFGFDVYKINPFEVYKDETIIVYDIQYFSQDDEDNEENYILHFIIYDRITSEYIFMNKENLHTYFKFLEVYRISCSDIQSGQFKGEEGNPVPYIYYID